MIDSDRGFKLLPPDGHIAVPIDSRPAAMAGLAMHASCKRSSLLRQYIAWWGTRFVGPAVLPGEIVTTPGDITDDTLRDLLAGVESAIGSFDSFAIHLRRPAARSGMSVLALERGTPKAFVKMRPQRLDGSPLDVERRALEALEATDTIFASPLPLAHGTIADWWFLAMSPLPLEVHRMHPDAPLELITFDVGRALTGAFDHPPGVPDHWLPMHGDFTPWNLRRLSDGRIVLFDWEDVDWAPPGADLLWHDAVIDAIGLGSRTSGRRHTEEATRFWIERLSESKRTTGRLQQDVLSRLRSTVDL